MAFELDLPVRGPAAAAPHRDVVDTVNQHAAGALAAQKGRDEIKAGGADPEVLHLRLVEIAARFGWKSIAVASFMREIGKRL